MVGRQPMAMRSCRSRPWRRSVSSEVDSSSISFCAVGSSSSPAGVSDRRRVLRVTSLMPRSSSSFFSRWLSAVCDRLRWPAARWKLPQLAMLRKASRP